MVWIALAFHLHMVGMVSYRPISSRRHRHAPPGRRGLEDGYPFVERMLQDWRLGENRFDGPGARLIGAFEDDRPIGFCGLCRDPFTDETVGRLRHLYVDRGHRQGGRPPRRWWPGRSMAPRSGSRESACAPRLRRGAFYEHLGFHPIDEIDATHAKRLR